MVGNTAFLEAVRWQSGTVFTSVTVEIKSNATLPGGLTNYFWAGQTSVFVEFLALVPGNTTFEPLADFGGIDFVHQVWPAQVTEAQVAAGMIVQHYKSRAP
jgi:hypothetical protein